ncbi:leucine-rich repeat protein [Flammeovirga kamogawensis]|uniref:Leucine-rich repeat protein n=1 Tax=Flammeovirga kamogawensis TaxID=373891 RepID=A0ABX8H0T1_9BACT|nr:leucine-rich repeat protein [Flammeovirga kamogawensis]MBB6463677.1 putative repeat protein (TIGR02543 family) [Flammeovirga kamogawensis]QWG09289.1 leucine-rich repeat protein [Flammeovirga kamogawensis]TRX64813.1 leucine-rich repeat protein [Flammeovirga kamogawensis]
MRLLLITLIILSTSLTNYAQINHALTESDVTIVNGEIKEYHSAYTHIIIPPILDGQEVTSIGERAFSNKTLLGVILPNTLKNIGDFAFTSNALIQIELPMSLKSIGRGAFQFNSIESVEFPASLTEIGSGAFQLNQIRNVVLPDSLLHIHNAVFSLNRLESIELPESLLSIGNFAFSDNLLTNIELPESLLRIGYSAFSNNLITSITLPNSLSYISDRMFYQNKLESVVLPDSLIYIGHEAFVNNELNSIVLPETLIGIGRDAFYNNNLSEIELPNSITDIGLYAFSGNQISNLTLPEIVNDGEWNVEVINNEVTVNGEYYYIPNEIMTLSSDDILIENGTIKAYFGSDQAIEIPSIINSQTVTSIADSVFQNKLLKKLILPNSLKSIGEFTFHDNKLTEIQFPESITNIGSGAFSNNKLMEIELPTSITTINTHSFSANKLTTIILPNSITSIDHFAFSNNRLTDIKLSESIISIANYAFFDNDLVNIDLPPLLKTIGASAFQYNKLIAIEFTESITSIGRYAFANNALNSVELPNSLTEIGLNAFNINNFQTFILPKPTFEGNWNEGKSNEEVPVKGYYFYGIEDQTPKNDYSVENGKIIAYNGKETSIEIPQYIDGVKIIAIGKSAFKNKELTNVVLPDSLVSIDKEAFSGNQLTSISIPSSVVYIGENAFSDNQFERLLLPSYISRNIYEVVNGWVSNTGEKYGREEEVVDLTKGYRLDFSFTGHLITLLYEDGKTDFGVLGTYFLSFEGQKSASFIVRKGSNIISGSTEFDEGFEISPIFYELKEVQENHVLRFKKVLYNYTINYHNAEGYEGVVSYTIESELIELPSLEREGYTFEGWYSDALFTTSIDEIPTGSSGDLDLYAKWSLNEITNVPTYETSVSIYPNPTSSYFRVESEQKIIEINIIDTRGILQKMFKAQKKYSVNKLSPGVYIVSITVSGGVINKKLIIE